MVDYSPSYVACRADNPSYGGEIYITCVSEHQMPKIKSIKIKVVQLPHAMGLALPSYQTRGSAGLDLLAAVSEGEPITIKPGKRDIIPTGLILELPKGTEAQVRPRSGLALKHGITVLNSPGTIDSDYRGEVKVILINLGDVAFKIERGERIAQMVIAKVARAKFKLKSTVTNTKRGKGGFGSTNVATQKSSPLALVPPKRTALAAKPRPATRTAAPKR